MSSNHLLAATLILAAFATEVSAAPTKCRLLQLAELPVTMTGLRPVVPVKINGADARLMADSGAFFSMLSPAAAARLGIRTQVGRGPISIRGVGGVESVGVASVKNFGFANVDLGKADFLIGAGAMLGGSDGVLGQNMLGGVEVEYDLANGVLRLFKAKDCEQDVIAYWAAEGKSIGMIPISRMTPQDRHITGEAKVNGQSIRVMFDTGASRSVLRRAAARRIGIRGDDEGVVSAGVSGGIGRRLAETWIVPVDSFEIADEKILHTRIRVADIQLNNADMLIGADFFLSHRVLISSSQHKLYFTYNGGPVFRLDRANLTDEGGEPAAVAAPTTTAEAGKEGAAPADAGAYSRRGAASMARRDFTAAIADFTRAADLEPGQAQHFHDRALARLNNRQPVLAMADLGKALKLKPDDRSTRLLRGQLYLQNQDERSARGDFDAALKEAKNDPLARLQIGGIYSRAGRFETAISEYDQAIPALPRGAATWEALNERCWTRALWGKELEKALADCDQAVKLAPRASHLFDSRGLVRLRLGEFDEAITDYDLAIKLQPKSAWSLYGRGLAKQHKGLAAEAEADIKAATAIDPTLAEQIKRYGIGT